MTFAAKRSSFTVCTV